MDRRGAEAAAAQLMMQEAHEGKLEHGRFHGYGHATFASGNEYRGDFVSGRVEGLGTMVWEDGLKYVGEFKHNCVSGRGCFDWPSGAEYYGDVLRGKRHGDGIYTFDDVRYAGEWKEGKRHGIGAQFSSSAVYYGEWEQGKRHGWGMIQFASGNRYQGMWAKDSMCGYGTMHWVSLEKWQNKIDLTKITSYKEAVEVARNAVLNVGSTTTSSLGPYTPASLSSSQIAQSYTGEWKVNKPHGEGEYTTKFHNRKGHSRDVPFQTQNKYVGEFVNGLRDGFGIYHYADGTVYEGKWEANLKHGPGTLHHADGTSTDMLMEHDTAKTKPAPLGASSNTTLNASSASGTPAHPPSASSTRFGSASTNRTHLQEKSESGAAKSPGKSSADKMRNQIHRAGADNRVNLVDLLPDILPLNMVGTKESQRCTHEVNEILSKNTNILRHLYTVYSTYHTPVDLAAAAVDLDDKESLHVSKVPTLDRIPALCRALQLPETATPLERNESMTNHAVGVVVERAMESCNQAIQKVMAATQVYEDANYESGKKVDFTTNNNAEGEGGITEGHVPTVEEIAKITLTEASQSLNRSGLDRAVEGGPPRPEGSLLQMDSRHDVSAATTTKSRRAATPIDSHGRSTLTTPQLPDMGKVPERRNIQSNLTLRQFHALLLDAQIVGLGLTLSDLNDCIYPAVLRRSKGKFAMKSLEDRGLLAKRDIGSTVITFPVFLEALVRIAHYKFTRTSPFMATTCKKEISLADQLRYMVESFLLPLLVVIKDMDHTGELRKVGLDPFFGEGLENSTLDDLRKAAIRLLKDQQRLSKPPAQGARPASAGGPSPGDGQSQHDGAMSRFGESEGRPTSADLECLSMGQTEGTAASDVTATAEAKRRLEWSGIASIRGIEATVEIIEIEITRTTRGSMSTGTHHLIVHTEDNVRKFGGIVMQYRLDQMFVADKKWRGDLRADLNRCSNTGGNVGLGVEPKPGPSDGYQIGSRLLSASAAPLPRVWMSHLPILETLEVRVADIFKIYKACAAPVHAGEDFSEAPKTERKRRVQLFHLLQLLIHARVLDLSPAADGSTEHEIPPTTGRTTTRSKKSTSTASMAPVAKSSSQSKNSGAAEVKMIKKGKPALDLDKKDTAKRNTQHISHPQKDEVYGEAAHPGPPLVGSMKAVESDGEGSSVGDDSAPLPSDYIGGSSREMIRHASTHTLPGRARPACSDFLKLLFFDIFSIELQDCEIEVCCSLAHTEHFGSSATGDKFSFGVDPEVLRSLLKTSPDLAEAIRLRQLEEEQREKLKEAYTQTKVKVGSKFWWAISQQIFLPFEELCCILVAVAQHIFTDERSLAAAINSLLDVLITTLQVDEERQLEERAVLGLGALPPGATTTSFADAATVSELWQTKNKLTGIGEEQAQSLESAPPIQGEKAWPKKKRTIPIEDPKKKKGGKK